MWSFYTVRGSDFGLFESMHPWDNSGQLWFKMALDAYEKTLKKISMEWQTDKEDRSMSVVHGL